MKYHLLTHWILYRKDGEERLAGTASSEEEAKAKCAKLQSKVKKGKRVYFYRSV